MEALGIAARLHSLVTTADIPTAKTDLALARLAFQAGDSLFSGNRIREALECYRLAQRYGLDDEAGVFQRWTCLMKLGEFEEAWRETDKTERKRRIHRVPQDSLPPHQRRVWNGESFEQKRVLIRSYHGLGDTIQFIRYAKMLKERAEAVFVQCEECLLPLLGSIEAIDRLIPLTCKVPSYSYDVEVELMELPYAYRTSLQAVPSGRPYLSVGARRLENKRASLTAAGLEDQQLNIGLCWASGGWDRTRDVPTCDLQPLLTIPGVKLFNLQKGAALNEFAGAYGVAKLIAAEEPDDGLCDTAAVICCLDLVISVDTMIAHLAGALGKPVWTLLPFQCDWRWMVETDRSPWYPSMRLFRQTRAGDWNGLIGCVSRELRHIADI